MSITQSGLFFLTLEKINIDTLGESVEEEDHNIAMITDTETPNFDTDDFFDDVQANEVSGAGYTARGQDLAGTELTTSSGTSKYDATDAAWATSTITSAMAGVGCFDGGSAAADELHFLSDFVTAATSSGGTFSIVWAAAGIYTVDFTP